MHDGRQTRAPRNTGLDALKTWAMLGVIFYHSFTASVDIPAGGMADRIHYFVYSAMCFCVPLFFLVNGYLLFSKPFDIRRHVCRTLRLVVLTELWQAVTLAALMPIKGEALGVGGFLQALLYGKAGWTDHFWFLGSLTVAYLFFPVAKAAFDHARGSFWFFVCATLALTFGNTAVNMAGNVAAFLVRGRGFETENFFSMFNAFAGIYGFAVGYFLLGGALYALRERLTRVPACVWGATVALCVLGQGAYGLMQSAWRAVMWDSVFLGYDTVFALAGAVSLFALAQRARFSPRAARAYAFTGAATLPAYLLQGIWIPALRPQALTWEASGSLLFAAGFAAFLFAVCILLAGVMKKIPGVKSLLRF